MPENITQFYHAYDMIQLSWAGYILGAFLILTHAAALLFPKKVQGILSRSARNDKAAAILLAVDFLWFAIMLGGWGPFAPMKIWLYEFEGIRGLLIILCPITCILHITFIKDLLFPRALGMFGLLAAAPLLSAAFLKDPGTRLLIPIWSYIVITLSIFWIAKPYLYRNMVSALLARPRLWAPLCLTGIAYGIAVLVSSILYW